MPEYIEQMVDWYCPNCGADNRDIPDQFTHCAACGRVVMVGNDERLVFDEGWSVDPRPVMRANKASTPTAGMRRQKSKSKSSASSVKQAGSPSGG